MHVRSKQERGESCFGLAISGIDSVTVVVVVVLCVSASAVLQFANEWVG